MSTLKPFLKWPGGKQRELANVLPIVPNDINQYFEPFVGGGAVYFAVRANQYFINDKSTDLIDLYQIIGTEKNIEFIRLLTEINNGWVMVSGIAHSNRPTLREFFLEIRSKNGIVNKDLVASWILEKFGEFCECIPVTLRHDLVYFQKELLVNMMRKLQRMFAIEQKKRMMSLEDIDDNIETALKSSFYMYFRNLLNGWLKYALNEIEKSAVYYFIRNYAYSSMFRYNTRGDFNVPYGGIGYNGNNLTAKIDYLNSVELSNHLKKTEVSNLDFEEFFLGKSIGANDFIFLDPPYDSDFSTYDKNVFSQNDQIRLADFLIKSVKCKWMMVIKNTEFIYSLYQNKGLYFDDFAKNYAVSFMNRNNKLVSHLVITNYQTKANFARQA